MVGASEVSNGNNLSPDIDSETPTDLAGTSATVEAPQIVKPITPEAFAQRMANKPLRSLDEILITPRSHSDKSPLLKVLPEEESK